MGVVLINKGNYSEGYGYIQKAANMDPYNQEYKDALDQINSSYRAANRRYYNVPEGSADSNFCGDCCTTCACLACTDACCECFGSDFISCFDEQKGIMWTEQRELRTVAWLLHLL